MSFLNNGRAGFAAALLFASFALSACTTVEGTNALVDASTFEREVANQTLQGLGMMPKEKKPMIETPRAPLVLPKDKNALPPPTEETAGLLPEDSDKVQIDASNLTEDELRRLRNARVVDLRSVSGRPLTETESRQLTARMTAARLKAKASSRPLFLPPDEYFTTVGGQDLVCLAENGDLVTLDDPACPPELRAALQ
ncbi:hypothetical protein [Mariluticola halotolerans]|uniref:hypothetical protein n=1 Tax=Mariluticola halotolerans TaxID=2909283 RepID=UPI0026E2219F|nr:hypothetical protein [Mariluticola halotolerans]UJQ95875.1 hypothetical protein L1P08_07805 [Mariluticola halotolerans]